VISSARARHHRNDLGYATAASRCDMRGNCEVERATFRYLDATFVERTGDMVDVHLKFQ
jgi:hypothetical protein